MNTHPDVRLNASLAPALAPRGRIGFYSHSAALGIVILDFASERGLGFSSFVSAGNRADVSGNDVLQYWEEDPSTDVALLYLETFGNPRRFARIARRISFRKPIVCVKSARSRAGRSAALAHIGAAAQSDTDVDMLFRQAGVIRAETLEEMFDVAALLSSQPLPRGGRVAIVSNSGGVLTICADACDARGLEVAESGAVDLGALATVEAFERAVQGAMERPDVDSLIAIFACVGNCDPQAVGRAIRRGVIRGERKSGVPKPALLCLMGAAGAVEVAAGRGGRPVASRHVFPSYRFPETAALALSRAVQYAAFRRRPAGRLIWHEEVDAAAARQQVMELLESSAGRTVWLEGERARGLLECFRIRLAAPGDEPPGAASAAMEIRSDPAFGPLLRLSQAGRPPAVRLTPLTDSDAGEIVALAGLPRDLGAEELLGRVSQMIEELPWLCAMDAGVRVVRSGAALGGEVRIGFEGPPRAPAD